MLQARQHRYPSLDDLLEKYHERRWTDGLPIVAPTPEAVQQFLDEAGLEPDVEAGVVDSWGARITAEHVAINAVMAGCRPEYLSVVFAAVKALARPAAYCHSTTATLANPAQLVIVNGPIRTPLGIHCEQGCFGPGHRANATIGRALRLVVNNVMRCLPGELDRSVFSTPSRYSFCFGENEEESPWVPLHIERGVPVDRSAVTVFSSLPMLMVPTEGTATPEEILDRYVDRLYYDGMLWERRMGFPADLVVVVGKEHQRRFTGIGWSKQDMRQWLWERLSALPGRDGFPHARQPVRLDGPQGILIVAAGGAGNPFTALLTPHAGRAVTEVVELRAH
ncbi:MAG TPA: hypothetical protein VLL25_04950 [Acidimicrobiales bacterium]|nr:hypothetical protein [Acidimicrobiales bacterium]